MQWEIVIVVILGVGIYAAVKEARVRQSARENETKAEGAEQHHDAEALTKQRK